MGAPLKRPGARRLTDEHLRELADLADTAGAIVVGELTQQIDRPHPGTYLGKGKIEELRDRVDEPRARRSSFRRRAVADAGQEHRGRDRQARDGPRRADSRHLRDARAHGRSEDAGRARAARVHAAATHAHVDPPREIPRRHRHARPRRNAARDGPPADQSSHQDAARAAAATCSADARSNASRGRSEFKASLVGYTNAGKSSILRALSGARDIFVENRLFATLDPLTRDVDLGDNAHVLVTDTVGFIRKLPHHLVASFRATLEETREADLLLHVIDASSPTWEEQRVVVTQVLDELEVSDRADAARLQQDRSARPRSAARAAGADRRAGRRRRSSCRALTDGGLEPLRRALASAIRASGR